MPNATYFELEGHGYLSILADLEKLLLPLLGGGTIRGCLSPVSHF